MSIIKKIVAFSTAINLALASFAYSQTPTSSAASVYKKSEDRKILASPRARGNRGPVYAAFMDSFWRACDEVLAKGQPKTVGASLDLIQTAFQKAAALNTSKLNGIGAKPALQIQSSSGGVKTVTAKQLQSKARLSADKDVQMLIGQKGNFSIGVVFAKPGLRFVDDPVAGGMQGGVKITDPVGAFKQVAPPSYCDMPALSKFIRTTNTPRLTP